MKKPLNFGLIGVGGIGQAHLRSLQTLEDENKVRLIAVADPTLPKLAEQKAQLGARGVRWHLDYQEMLENESALDAVAIVTPVPLHFEMARRCSERGLWTYLEKPPVPLIQQLEELIALDVHSRIAVGFQMICTPQVQAIKKLIVSGALGAVEKIRIGACWPRQNSYYRRASWSGKMSQRGEPVFDGPATNALAHLIHNAMFLASGVAHEFVVPAEIQAELYRARPIESYDIASLRGRFDSGATFTAALVHATDSYRAFRLEVQGSRGWARISEDGTRLESSLHPEPQDSPNEAMLDGCRDFVAFASGEKKHPATRLADARGYLLATNGALLSSAKIHTIDPAFWRTYEADGGDVGYAVHGLAELVDQSFATGCLFSELNAPWAVKTSAVDVRNLKSIDFSPYC